MINLVCLNSFVQTKLSCTIRVYKKWKFISQVCMESFRQSVHTNERNQKTFELFLPSKSFVILVTYTIGNQKWWATSASKMVDVFNTLHTAKKIMKY